MSNLPMEFQSHAQADKNFEDAWVVTSGKNQTHCAIPPEFGGSGGGFSPEDLFLQAAINCFIGTFKVMTKMSRINFETLEVKGSLVVDKNSIGKTVMKSIHLEIMIGQVERPERTEAIALKAIKEGFILNSLNSEITHSIKIL